LGWHAAALFLSQHGYQKTRRIGEFFARKLDSGLYSAGVVLPVAVVAPGQKTVFSVPLYAGPAQSSLDKVAPGLGLTVDYGWLTILATPLFWLMILLQSFVHNWGCRDYFGLPF